MSDATSKKWNVLSEAKRAFTLTDHVSAVVFCSDVAVIKKVERGPSRRLHDKLMRQIEELIRSSKFEEARAAIGQALWKGPQTIWWTESIPKLTEVIERHDQIIRERKIAAGVSVEEFIPNSTVVLFNVWWDR